MDTDRMSPNAEKLLEAQAVGIVRGNRSLLREVSLAVHASELIGLIGPNGAGKSTLLTTLAGLNEPDAGQVMLQNKPIHDYTDNERARRVGWMEQLAYAHWPVSVEHLVMLGRIPYLSRWQSPSEEDRALVQEILAATDCVAVKDQPVTTLSGGELTRVMLARALASEPSILLADEPTAALDIGHQLQTMDLLRAFSTNNRACVVVLHDLSLAARYCDRVYLLNDARMVASGAPFEVLSNENIRSVYGVEMSVSDGDIPYIVPLRRTE